MIVLRYHHFISNHYDYKDIEQKFIRLNNKLKFACLFNNAMQLRIKFSGIKIDLQIFSFAFCKSGMVKATLKQCVILTNRSFEFWP